MAIRYSSSAPSEELSEEDRRLLWEQFVEVHADSQESFDTSIRAMAAAGVGVTVSLATALHKFPAAGLLCVVWFLSSLTLNFLSYWTAQFDMKARIACLRRRETDGIEGNGWTTATTTLNAFAGLGVIAGGIFLAIYISQAA